MALVPVNTRNRINPIPIPNFQQPGIPYATYDHVEVCNDPNCPVCRAQRRDRHHKRHHHHRHHHHHKKHKSNFWSNIFPRVESASSTVTIHSIELDERRPYYDSYANERSVVPVEKTERQVVTQTRPRRLADDDAVREAWVKTAYFYLKAFQMYFLF